MVKLVCAATLFAGIALCQNPAVTITIDAAVNKHAINPNIYGVAYGTSANLSDLNAPLNRQGGNNTSRYNWQANADNRGNDWYFESIGDASAVAGERGDTFITNTKAAGAQAMLTIPMIGWVGKVGASRSKLASFSQAKYGTQTGNDSQWYPDAGNGVLKSTGTNITGNDPNDANVASDSLYQQGWMQHLVNTFGTAGAGGLKYYIMDNEPSIWFSTHRDVAPTGATMSQVRDKILDYAGRAKTVDPTAQIIGPEEWGWSGYLYSGYDQQWGNLHGWSSLPDRTANGNMDYLPWLLDQLRKTTVAGGLKPLDIFSVHYYPQGGEFGNDVSTTMQLRRNRSTRSLWDPNYVDETWINDKVQLIPRLRNWANTYYFAGTPIAVTEYNWGAEAYMNGATAQADIYGIFGRENLDMATRWTTPDPSTPTYKAMKMYRNYDGNKLGFGDTSVLASAPSPDNVSAFAATRASDGALTVMVINKYLTGTTPVTISTANFSGNGSAQVYQLTSANAITRLSDIVYSGTSLTATVPQQSITLLVLSSGTPNIPPTAVIAAPSAAVTGNAPLVVAFDATGSSDPDGTIASYAWAFGDGAVATGITASHTYTTAGAYTAILTVTDNRGATANATVSITVNPDPSLINAPSNLTASSASGVVTLNWKDNSTNETGFYIERAPSGSTSFVQVGSVAANVIKYTETRPRGSYLYRVRAYNSSTGTTSAYSNQVQIRVK